MAPERVVTNLADKGSVNLADLGPAEACACVPNSIPVQTDWRRCSIAAINKAGLKSAITFSKGPNAFPAPRRDKLPEGFQKAIILAELQCGSFASVTKRANEINGKRRSMGYESYIVVQHPDQLFSGMVRESRSHYAAKGGKN
jgi:cell division septation protein DedD